MRKLDAGDASQLQAQIIVKIWGDGAMSIEGPTGEPLWCIAALEHAIDALRNQIRPKDVVVTPSKDTSLITLGT